MSFDTNEYSTIRCSCYFRKDVFRALQVLVLTLLIKHIIRLLVFFFTTCNLENLYGHWKIQLSNLSRCLMECIMRIFVELITIFFIDRLIITGNMQFDWTIS